LNFVLIALSSSGYNAWRDTKKPTTILNELCRTAQLDTPVYAADFRSLTVGDQQFECDPECIEFVKNISSFRDCQHRKAQHETFNEYIKQNTALAALHEWGRKINSVKHSPFFSLNKKKTQNIRT